MTKTNDNDGYDWLDELTDEQQLSVLRGLKQADNREGIQHEEALLRLKLLTESLKST